MHPRTLIRKAIVSAVLDSTAAGVRVFPTRKTDHLENELPVISVYSLSEDSELVIEPREYERHLRVLIECVVTADSDVDDAMDDLAKEVENAMDADYTFGGVCYESELKSTDLESADEGGREVGILEMVYEFGYRTDAFVAPSGVDATTDYTNSTVEYDIEGNQAVEDKTNDAFVMEE